MKNESEIEKCKSGHLRKLVDVLAASLSGARKVRSNKMLTFCNAESRQTHAFTSTDTSLKKNGQHEVNAISSNHYEIACTLLQTRLSATGKHVWKIKYTCN